jgi:Hypothetical protein (DUF2513)
VEIEGYDEVIVARHLEMLLSVGLIEGQKIAPLGGDCPIILVKDLSWEGHDFASALLKDTVWSQIKKKFSAADLATLPLSVVRSVGVGLLEQLAKTTVGL